MFKVKFCTTDVYEAPNVEPAISFALEIHRVSNVPHIVYVVDPDGENVVSLDSTKLSKK